MFKTLISASRAPFERSALALALMGVGLAQAQAQTQTQSQTEVPVLPTVQVRSAVGDVDLQSLPASADVIDGRRLQAQQLQVNLSEGLQGVPGLTLNNRNNYAQDLQLSVRGYGARSTFGVRGVRIYVDGIPATMPDGQGQTSNVDIATLDRVEVLRGPYSALYGNSSGGIISFYTQDPSGPLRLSTGFSVGRYGQQRLDTQASGQTAGGIGYLVSASRFLTDGYRTHSAADRNLLNAKLVVPMAGDARLTLVANHTKTFALDPQGLTWAQWQANPRQASAVAEQFNTRKSLEQQQIGVSYERPINAAHRLSLSAYYGTRSMVQYQSIPASAQRAAGHAGGVIDMGRDFGGLRAQWTGKFDTPVPVQVAAGVDLQQVSEDRRGYENFIGPVLGVHGNLRRDERNRVTSTDPFVQASWQLAPRWVLDTGLRYSRVRFDTRDYYVRPGNTDDSGRSTQRKLLPVASLAYKLSPLQTVYASVGRGFETPTITELSYRNDGAGLNTGLQPSVSTQWELGWRQRLQGEQLRGVWSAALFSSNTRNEIVSDRSVGGRSTFRNAGQTRRRGLELAADLVLAKDWQLRAAYTWLDARYRGGPGVDAALVGNYLPGVSRHSAYLGADWRFAPGWTLGAGIDARSKVYANDLNRQHVPGYATLALSLGYRKQLSAQWHLDAFARVDNALDKNYIGSVIVNDGNERYFESAMGRNVSAGVKLAYQF